MDYDGKLKFDTKIDESGFNAGISKLGTLAKSGFAVLASYVTSFAVLTKSALDEVASLEQNVGGIETLFGAGGKSLEDYAKSVGKSTEEAKESYRKLMEAQTLALNNANKAYKTAGLSANDYMSTVTSFAASLKQSVADEVEAAKAADQAVIDMSDNANKMGTDMSLIQNAYQGFAKQNYTMLDNLKLGYSQGKTEMERLLADAEKLSGVKYDINNLADVYSAIHVIQTELGITGTTADEAATTIEGSMNSAKAAWSNFLAGVGTTDELVAALDTVAGVVGESLGEIVPRLIETIPAAVQALIPLVLDTGMALAEAGMAIMKDFIAGVIEVAPQLPKKGAEILTKLIAGIQENAPAMLTTATEVFANFLEGIAEQIPELIPKALEMIVTLADSIISNLPTIISAGIKVLKALVQGIIESLPTLIAEGPRIINDFADVIFSSLWELITAGFEMIKSLVQGIWDNRHLLLENAGEIFWAFLNVFSLKNLFNLGKNLITKLKEGIKKMGPQIKTAGKDILTKLVNGIKSLATHPVETMKGILKNVIDKIKNIDFISVGKDIVNGIIKGLKNGAGNLIDEAKKTVNNALAKAKEALGIKSPSRRFRDEVGKMMALGMGIGFKKNIPIKSMTADIDDTVKQMQRKVSIVTTDNPKTVAGFDKKDMIFKSENQGIDYKRLEKIQMKAADKMAKRPIFLGSERIDRPLPKGAVPTI